MVNSSTIYTYGNIGIDVNELIRLIQPHGINCVVDCRPVSSTCVGRNTPRELLQEELLKHHITYLPFYNHFGLFPPETRGKKGTILYKRVINAPNFREGFEHLENEIQKGCSICIIDGESDLYKSKRYTIIAKRLKEQYNIVHLFDNGHYFSHEQMELQKEANNQKRQQEHSAKQAIGTNGEEIAALYLARNGYQILDRNWNLHRDCELDIVAMKDNTLHFIEVKTRTSDQYGEPQIAINYTKMKHLLKAIRDYRYKHDLHQISAQIDSIAIIYRAENDYDLKHFLGIRTDGNACADVVTFHKRP